MAFAEDCIGSKAEAAIARMKNGDILCLENTRFHPEEEKNDHAMATKLAALGEYLSTTHFPSPIARSANTAGVASKLPPIPAAP